MSFLKGNINDLLVFEADNTNTLKWNIDVYLAVQADMKSHTGVVFTMGKGTIIRSSTNQEVNHQSSTESNLIGVDEKIAKVILWMKHFLEWQVFPVKLNIIYQGNNSSIIMEANGKESSVK